MSFSLLFSPMILPQSIYVLKNRNWGAVCRFCSSSKMMFLRLHFCSFPPPKWGRGSSMSQNICAQFVLFVLQTVRICAFILHPLSQKQVLGCWGNIGPPIKLQGRVWCRTFVLNLCYLCLKVPEFVLLSLVLYIRQKFGGAGNSLK